MNKSLLVSLRCKGNNVIGETALKILVIILKAADEHRCLTLREIAEAAGVYMNAAHGHIKILRRNGLLNNIKGGRTLYPTCRAVFFKQKQTTP